MESVANGERGLEMLADYIDTLNARSDDPLHVWRVGASLHPKDDNPIPLDPATLRAQARALREYAVRTWAEAHETVLIGGVTVKHEFPIGARIALSATRCPIDDATDGEDEHEFRDEPAIVVEHLNGDPAADYLVYVPRTRRAYPCVPADMARL